MTRNRSGRRAAARSAGVVLAVVVAGVVATGPATAAPADVSVSAWIAPAGSSVEVSGTGCTGEVTVDVVAWDLERPEPSQQVTTTPSTDGAWTVDVEMPPGSAYVAATCDGVESVPVVMGSTSTIGTGRSEVVDGDSVAVRTSGLVPGTTFRVVEVDGALLGEHVVGSDGEGRVELPYVPTRDSVVALALFPWVDPLFLPRLLEVELPMIGTSGISPRVVGTGDLITLSGTGCLGDVPGTASADVIGESDGWEHANPVVLRTTRPAAADGSWSFTVAAPRESLIARTGCSIGWRPGIGSSAVVGVRDAPSFPTVVTPVPGGSVVQLRRFVSSGFGPGPTYPTGLEVFDLAGRAVPFTDLGSGRVEVHGAPGPVLVLGSVWFDEWAPQDAIETPYQAYADLPGPRWPPPGPTPSPGAVDDGSAAAPVRDAPELAATGSVATDATNLALVLLVVGCGSVLLARRGAGRQRR